MLLAWYEEWLIPKFAELDVTHALVQVEPIRGVLDILRNRMR